MHIDVSTLPATTAAGWRGFSIVPSGTVTVIGFMVGSLIAGAVVVESVFSWPGVGRLLVSAVANRDLAVVQCILLLVAATMVLSNLLVDALYGLIDPRLRAGRSRQGGH